jgi:hypothetical protein
VKWTETETAPYYSGTWIGPEAERWNLVETVNRQWDNFAVIPESSIAEDSIVVTFGTHIGTYMATGKINEGSFRASLGSRCWKKSGAFGNIRILLR